MGGIKEPTFKINPRFRLTTKHLSVVWHCVDKLTLECEAALTIPDRFVYQDKNSVELLVQYHDGIMDMIYHDFTDFETRKIQKWLRELMRDTILRIAKVVLPARVKYWENMKGLHGSGVTSQASSEECSRLLHVQQSYCLATVPRHIQTGMDRRCNTA